MLTLIAVLLGKAISLLTKTLRLGGGSAAPGLYSLKVDPKLIEKLINKIPKNVIITGTNGKTTTAKLLAHFAKESGLKVIRNHTGSNMERGIASTLIQHTDLVGLMRETCEVSMGIWEVDEAAFNTLAPKIKPDIVVFLNVFRDQLDRYGEINSIVKKWEKTLNNLDKKTIILINGDDLNTKKLKNSFRGKSLTFGVDSFKIAGEGNIETTGKLDFEAKNVKLNGLAGSFFHLQSSTLNFPVTLPLPGLYNIYNFLASFSTGFSLGFTPKTMTESLKSFTSAFGRVEKFTIQPPRLQAKDGYIFLIKNPVGANQVFKTLIPVLKPGDRLLLALNDNLADGKDVSWIWDVNFEVLSRQSSALRLICSGVRAYDLALRLKYAGVDQKQLTIEPGVKKALSEAQKGLKGRLFILPTYTAMLELQKILTKQGIKKHYWKEEEKYSN